MNIAKSGSHFHLDAPLLFPFSNEILTFWNRLLDQMHLLSFSEDVSPSRHRIFELIKYGPRLDTKYGPRLDAIYGPRLGAVEAILGG